MFLPFQKSLLPRLNKPNLSKYTLFRTLTDPGPGVNINVNVCVSNPGFPALILRYFPGAFGRPEKNGITTITIAGYMTQMSLATRPHARPCTWAMRSTSCPMPRARSRSRMLEGPVTAEELHRAILVTQQMRFARVMKTEEWVKEG